MRRNRAFTLVEMLVVVAIIGALTAVATLSWRSATAQSVRSLTVNTLTGFIGVARSYAMSNRIETMLVVNPFDGRLELWHANPPVGQQRNPPWGLLPGNPHPDDLDGFPANGWQFPDGGEWDPASSGDGSPTQANASLRARANGYAFAPVLDTNARLPVDGNGVPRVLVSPLDYVSRNPANANNLLPSGEVPGNLRAAFDNLAWTAFCFAPDGRMVTAARRIDMNHRGDPLVQGNYAPRASLSSGTDFYSVDAVAHNEPGNPHGYDTLVLSAAGFVVSERQALEAGLGRQLIDVLMTGDVNALLTWLASTGPGQPNARFADRVLLNPWNGRVLATEGR